MGMALQIKDSELKRLRDKALYNVYVKGLQCGEFESMREAAKWVRKQPAPQYFISSREASLLIGKILNGHSLIGLNSLSRKRIWRIYDMYMEYSAAHPNTNRTRERILEDLVEQAAPEFYLSAEMSRKILQKELAEVRRNIALR